MRTTGSPTGNRLLIGPFAQDLQNGYVLTAPVSIGSNIIELVDATGFLAKSLIKLEEEINEIPTTFYAEVITNIANVLTLDRPIDRAFTVAAFINRENFLLNVDGSSQPIEFVYKNSFDKPVNLERMMLNMVTTSNTPYDGFGDIVAPGLSKGIEVRKKNVDGTYTNYFNAKTNNRLDLIMFDLSFFDPSQPQAVNGVSGRFTFSKLGSPVILQKDEEIQILVQDPLQTLLSFEAVVEGNRNQ